MRITPEISTPNCHLPKTETQIPLSRNQTANYR